MVVLITVYVEPAPINIILFPRISGLYHTAMLVDRLKLSDNILKQVSSAIELAPKDFSIPIELRSVI